MHPKAADGIANSVDSYQVYPVTQVVLLRYFNVCEALICKLVYLFIVFGEHGRYIGNINHLWR